MGASAGALAATLAACDADMDLAMTLALDLCDVNEVNPSVHVAAGESGMVPVDCSCPPVTALVIEWCTLLQLALAFS